MSTHILPKSTDILSLAGQLADTELVAQVKVLSQREREATAALIAHLSVLDERRLYLAEGCSSMFMYCVQVLHLSEYAAYSRIEAARAVRKCPIILDMLSDGSLNLTTLGLLVPELTPENHLNLLERARHQSKRQVQELVAGLRPQSPVPSVIRKLPTPSNASASTEVPEPAPGQLPGALSAEAGTPEADPIGFDSCDQPARPAAQPPARRAVLAPLAPERYKVQFTASAQTCEKMRLAQDLLRRQVPDGDLGEVIDRALTVLLKELTKQKFAATDRPRESRDAGSHGTVPGSRYIPAEVKRAVWMRDGGRCSFVGEHGRRCTERGFLEFHHVVPYGAGGEATLDNIQLRCRAHNQYEAELFFGERSTLRIPDFRNERSALGLAGSHRVRATGDLSVDILNWVRTQLCLEGNDDSPGSLTNWIRQADVRRCS